MSIELTISKYSLLAFLSILFFTLPFGCADPVALATLATYEDIRSDQEEEYDYHLKFIGLKSLAEPCVFSIYIVNSDDKRRIVGYEKTCGELPSGYRLVVEESEVDAQGVEAWIKGPPVGIGIWDSCFVATDTEGNKSSAGRLRLECFAGES